jgi:hypothetical protein
VVRASGNAVQLGLVGWCQGLLVCMGKATELL